MYRELGAAGVAVHNGFAITSEAWRLVLEESGAGQPLRDLLQNLSPDDPAALQRARRDMGLDNIKLMIPFCRRVPEAERVLTALASHGLRRGEDGLEVYMMCEIPNNVVQIDAFSALFDGISIGSNDLTQLVLGVDRDPTSWPSTSTSATR